MNGSFYSAHPELIWVKIVTFFSSRTTLVRGGYRNVMVTSFADLVIVYWTVSWRFASDNVVLRKLNHIIGKWVFTVIDCINDIEVFVDVIYCVRTGYVPYPLMDVRSSLV